MADSPWNQQRGTKMEGLVACSANVGLQQSSERRNQSIQGVNFTAVGKAGRKAVDSSNGQMKPAVEVPTVVGTREQAAPAVVTGGAGAVGVPSATVAMDPAGLAKGTQKSNFLVKVEVGTVGGGIWIGKRVVQI